MKTSLWVVVVVVVGIVGFLLGYSYSSYSGVRAVNMIQATGGEAKEETQAGGHEPAAGYGAPAQQAAAEKGGSPGYGAPAAPSTPPPRRAKPAAVTAGY